MAEEATRDLYEAIVPDYLPAVQEALDRGAVLNRVGTRLGFTPLTLAIKYRRTEIARLLLERGSDPNLPDANGDAPIHYAKDQETIQMLRERGADLNARNAMGETPVTLALNRSRDSYENTLVFLLEAGADPNVPDRNGVPPLSNALEANNLTNMLVLLGKGANPNIRGSSGDPLVFSLIEFLFITYNNGVYPTSYMNVLREMLRAGVKPDVRDSEGATLFHHIAAYLRGPVGLEIVRILVEAGGDPNSEDTSGMTPLEQAVYLGLSGKSLRGAIGSILDFGFDPNALNSKGTSLLQRIVDRTDVVPKLLAKVVENAASLPNLDINLRNRRGETALHIAARRNNLEVVQVLVNAGADTAARIESDGGEGARPIDLTTNESVKELLRGYRGKSRLAVELFQRVFDDPVNISFCPVCLAYTERADGCRYMSHECKPEERNEDLYQRFRGKAAPYLNKIEWCTECGRVCGRHRHYMLKGVVQSLNQPLEFAPISPERRADVQGQIVHYQSDCRPSGGGGLTEKFIRFYGMIQASAKLQRYVGAMSEKAAKVELTGNIWSAPLEVDQSIRVRFEELAELLRNPPPEGSAPEVVDEWNARVMSLKTFDVDLSIFAEDAPPAAGEAEEPDAPDVPRPEADRDLTPIKHAGGGPAAAGGADNICVVEAGIHEDNRPVYQFRHRQPDGSVWNHEGEYICAEDLVALIRANRIDGKCPINPANCKGLLYPEELQGIVPDEFYETYRKLFNQARRVRGGRRKTYRRKSRHRTSRRQRGGSDIVKTMFRRLDDEEYTCGVEIGAF